MKRLLITMAGSILTASGLFADDATVRYDSTDYDRTRVVNWHSERDWVNYKGNEIGFSVFGTATVGDDTIRRPSGRRIERDGELGLGTGLTYFFHRNVGVEAYGFTESTHNNFFDYVGGNLIARFPLFESGVAPYVLGGGGRQLDPLYQWYWDAGGGIEWRFVKSFGVFVDARYVWADTTKDYGLGRLGLKFGF